MTRPEFTYDLEQKWLKALRSGKYAQTTGTLCKVSGTGDSLNKSYCCLGVLAEVLVDECVLPPTEVGLIDRSTGTVHTTELPYDMATARYGETHPLIKWNDELRRNFNEIANSIDNGSVYTDRG
jgi:hypothetical protein